MKTKQPAQGMQNIADDVYFAPGVNAFSNNKTQSNSSENVRAFAGYAGWAPGQLENEIRRGDWVVIQSKLDIIFTSEFSSLWSTLLRAWSGTWI
jgi:putative transcriptional regulator